MKSNNSGVLLFDKKHIAIPQAFIQFHKSDADREVEKEWRSSRNSKLIRKLTKIWYIFICLIILALQGYFG